MEIIEIQRPFFSSLLVDSANQANYTSFYGGVDPIQNFVHDHVLRYSFTSVMGDAIPASQTSAGNSYRLKYDYSLPTNVIANPNQVEIVAMILDSNGDLLNVNVAVPGNHEFDFALDNTIEQFSRSKFPWILSNLISIDNKADASSSRFVAIRNHFP